MIPPVEFVSTEVITAPHFAIISWMILYIVQDKETYTVQYSTDMLLRNSSEVVIEVTNGFVFHQNFSVNITGLNPFITYYYKIQANNSAGNISTDVMTFNTNQTGIIISVIITYAIIVTLFSYTLHVCMYSS